MTLEEFETLKVGDKVKCIGDRSHPNWYPEMDKWAGRIMTVYFKRENFCKTKESVNDGRASWMGGWAWSPSMLEKVTEEDLLGDEVPRAAKAGEYIKLIRDKESLRVGDVRCAFRCEGELYVRVEDQSYELIVIGEADYVVVKNKHKREDTQE